jgi:hypothetical protein
MQDLSLFKKKKEKKKTRASKLRRRNHGSLNIEG